MSNSISDQARFNIEAQLTTDLIVFTEQDSNIDLFDLLVGDASQVLVTTTDASVANQYWEYLNSLREGV